MDNLWQSNLIACTKSVHMSCISKQIGYIPLIVLEGGLRKTKSPLLNPIKPPYTMFAGPTF